MKLPGENDPHPIFGRNPNQDYPLPGENEGCFSYDLTREQYSHLLDLWGGFFSNWFDAREEDPNDEEAQHQVIFWHERLEELAAHFQQLTSDRWNATMAKTLYPARKPYLTAADIVFLRSCGTGLGGASCASVNSGPLNKR